MSLFRPAEWTDREKAGALLGAVVVLVAVAYLAVWRPVQGRLVELDGRIRSAERELAGFQRLLASDLRAAVATEYAKYGERLRSTLSPAEESAAMLRTLEELASRAGVSLIATRPQEAVPRTEPDGEEYGVELDVEGDLARLLAFFHGIQASPQLMRVGYFELDRKDKAAPPKGRVRVSKVVTR